MRKTCGLLAFLLAAILVLGLTAQAQVAPRPAKPRPAPADRPTNPEITGLGDLRLLDTADKREWFFQNVCIRRFLMPPNKRELAQMVTLLGLTDPQKQQIRQLYAAFVGTVRPILQQRAAATKELFAALQSQTPSKEALNAAYDKTEQADKSIVNAEFDFWIALRQILSPQQQQQMMQFMQQKIDREATPRTRVKNPAPPAPQPPK